MGKEMILLIFAFLILTPAVRWMSLRVQNAFGRIPVWSQQILGGLVFGFGQSVLLYPVLRGIGLAPFSGSPWMWMASWLIYLIIAYLGHTLIWPALGSFQPLLQNTIASLSFSSLTAILVVIVFSVSPRPGSSSIEEIPTEKLPTPTLTSTATATLTPTNSPTPTTTFTSTVTATFTASPTFTPTFTPTPEPIEISYWISFDHVQPGKYSEVYVDVTGPPGTKVTATLKGPGVTSSKTQSGTIGNGGSLRLTWRINAYGTYTATGTIGSTSFTLTVEVK
jgi:hypothetical protein